MAAVLADTGQGYKSLITAVMTLTQVLFPDQMGPCFQIRLDATTSHLKETHSVDFNTT